ncbi:hornerin-like [Iris pallida]|uniref:Hornerin-like n=1 Tax=Iris pallida TaxID=29817 RepID=A0AAX6HXI7_IRIPA|nr:hornerin-like [Iris pallida]
MAKAMLLATAQGMESPVGTTRGRGRGRRKLFAKAGSSAALLDESGFWDPAEMALTRGVAPASRRDGSTAQRRRQRTRTAGKRAWPDLPCWDSRTPAWVSIGHGRTRLEQRSGIRWCPVMGRVLTRVALGAAVAGALLGTRHTGDAAPRVGNDDSGTVPEARG